jgi:hypothetical protein
MLLDVVNRAAAAGVETAEGTCLDELPVMFFHQCGGGDDTLLTPAYSLPYAYHYYHDTILVEWREGPSSI